MSRERYPVDKLFEEIAAYFPKMDPILAKIDVHLENARITELALKSKVTSGKKLRTDGTVIETNIHAPSDSRQLADSVVFPAKSPARR